MLFESIQSLHQPYSLLPRCIALVAAPLGEYVGIEFTDGYIFYVFTFGLVNQGRWDVKNGQWH